MSPRLNFGLWGLSSKGVPGVTAENLSCSTCLDMPFGYYTCFCLRFGRQDRGVPMPSVFLPSLPPKVLSQAATLSDVS